MTDYTKFPGAGSFGIGQRNDYVTQLGTWLIGRGAGSFYTVGAGPSFGAADQAACAAFQRAQGWTGSDADGIPGAGTWKLLATHTGRDIPVWVSPIPLSAVRYEWAAKPTVTVQAAVQSICARLFVPAAAWLTGITVAVRRESGGQLAAINTTDNNAHGAPAPDGYPANCSRGLLQCIPSTFAAHHMAGTSNNIYDAEANIGAAMNWVRYRYSVKDDGSNLAAAVQQFDPARSPKGY